MSAIGRASAAVGIVLVAGFILVWLLPSTTAISPPEPQALGPTPSGKARVVSKEERDDALARGQVWRRPASQISKVFLGNPPDAPSELECTFELSKPSGTTPKFDCIDDKGRKLRVKYGRGGELHAEAATTRLLSALGFGADSITLVERLKCLGCPKEPFTVMKFVEGTHTTDLYNHNITNEQSSEVFNWVAVEQRFPAAAIESQDGTEGWAFHELDKVRSDKGGAPRAHVDALRLLAVFIAHWDNKSANQRIVCLSDNWPESARCPRPFLMMQDVGATFGPRKVDLKDWERATIWQDRSSCTITMEDLPVKGATFQTISIGDEGRLLLAGLLDQLTDEQLKDLFAGARFDHRRGPLDPYTPVADWVQVFKARRSAISGGSPCPSV